jgi:hypothetical protein
MMGTSCGLAAADGSTVNVLVWGAAGIACLLVLGLVLLAVRRRFVKWMTEPPRRMDFSVTDLEVMRRRGTISPEEFRVLRRSAMGLADRASPPEAGKGPEK